MMYSQEEFAEFLEVYRKQLADDKTLEEILKEGMNGNHRLKKLSVCYPLKNEATFYQFCNCKIGRKYLKITKRVLMDIKNDKVGNFGTEDLIDLSEKLFKRYFSDINLEPIFCLGHLELKGYCSFLADYIREKKEKEMNIPDFDVDSLEFVDKEGKS